MGGLRLSKDAKEIGLGEVLRTIESWKLVECFEPAENTCPIAGACGLQRILGEALQAYLSVLDKYSLADIVRKKSVLVQLLGLKVVR